MTSDAVVNRYASALVDVVVGATAGIDPAVAINQLHLFDDAVKSSRDLQIILASPAVPIARKRAVIRQIGAALQLERILINFLLVLCDHRRASALSQVIDSFEILLDERLGFVRAAVQSAYELTADQRDRLLIGEFLRRHHPRLEDAWRRTQGSGRETTGRAG